MQLSENWTLLLCYTTYSVCLWTGTESTCSLVTYLHLNEYDPDCLLSVCVICVCACVRERACIYIHHSSIDYNVRVFLFLSLRNQCRLLSHKWVFPDDLSDFAQLRKCSVCLHCVPVLPGRPGLAEDLTDSKQHNALWVLNFWTHTLNSLMWLKLVRRQVNGTLWAVFYGRGYESVALFSATEHGANLWLKWMDFMPRNPSTAP